MLELIEVNGIGQAMALKLKDKGIDTIKKLASIDLKDLLQVSGIGESTGKKYIEAAKELIKEKQKKQEKNVSSELEQSDETIISEEQEISKEEESISEESQKEETSPKSTIETQEKIVKIPSQKVDYKQKRDFSKSDKSFKKSASTKPITKKAQRSASQISTKGRTKKRRGKLPLKTFFPGEVMQRIRFLHHKIKHLEESLEKKEDFSLDELAYVLDYVKVLNINYKTQSQIKIFKELNITQSFYDPIDEKEIKIWDLMFECTRVLWVLARVYAYLSEKFETEKQMKNAIIAMVECSKVYKTATYFSGACTRQEEIGISLSSENLEINSEEARILAQNLAAVYEENKENFYLASQMYAGLSALSKRLYFLKKHKKIKQRRLKAQFHYDLGKACQLKANGLLKSSIAFENEEKVKKLKQKSNYYFSKAEEIWESLVKKPGNLSRAEIDNLRVNLSIVNENIIQNDTEILDYKEIKNIQNPEPFIAAPENIGLFLPRSTMYLAKYHPRDLNFGRYKAYKISKLDLGSRKSKIDRLKNQKAGIGRTIKQLKFLYENNDIDINIFFELLEKYEIKLEIIESTIEKFQKPDKTSEVDKKRAKQDRVTVYTS